MLRNSRFLIALAGFAALAVLAWTTLDGEFLWATWLILALCALKTVLVVLRSRLD